MECRNLYSDYFERFTAWAKRQNVFLHVLGTVSVLKLPWKILKHSVADP